MAKAGYSEVDAMRDVDAALSNLKQDAQQRVIEWAASKYALKIGRASAPEPIAQVPHPQGDAGATTGVAKNIKSFLAQKRPESFYERVACLVYYLEKFDGKNRGWHQRNHEGELRR
jgi:hypothetical protein